MDVTVQRTESDRSQNQNGGPRVSFNRDVHVKRIGPRPTPGDPSSAASPTLPPSTSGSASVFRRELPTDLSAEGIRKEAALVLAQADSVKCTAEGGSNDIVGGRALAKTRGPIERRRTFDYNTNKIFSNGSSPKDERHFNSLPTRKHKSKTGGVRPVARSVSDASSKKSASKRPSIFSIFSRKSDSNLHDSSATTTRGDVGDNNRKRVGRSKSDVGAQPFKQPLRKRTNSENEEQQHLATTLSGAKKNRAPLSPIIEQSQREDYFNTSEINAAEPPTAKATKLSAPAPPKRRDKRNGNRSTLSRSSANSRPEAAQLPAAAEEEDILQIIPAKPVAEAIKDTISTLKRSNSRTAQEMHSSQLPQQKPPLTKGVTVDGMVKRLSMERFSPPPHLSGPAFSYTRPKDQIIYAQVVCDSTDGKSKQTVHSSYDQTPQQQPYESGRGPSPARNGITSPSSHHLDAVDGGGGSGRRHASPAVKTTTNTSTSASHTQRHNSDEDEGLGLEIKARAVHDDFMPAAAAVAAHDNRRYSPRDLRTTASDDEFKSVAEDMPITPKIRDVPPEKYVYHQHYPAEVITRGRADGMDVMQQQQHPGNEFGDLSHRRAKLESRIKNRRFGSRDHLTEEQHEDDLLQKNPAYNYHQEYPTGEPVRLTKLSSAPPMTNRDYVKRLSPPSRDIDDLHLRHQHQQHQNGGPSSSSATDRYRRSRSTDVPSAGVGDRHNKNSNKKYHEFGSQEVLSRYSPERSHLDMIGTAAKYPPQQNGVSSKYEEESRYYHDGREGYKETTRRETSIGPDGKPRVSESVSRERLDTPPTLSRGHRVTNGGHLGDDYHRDKYVKDSDRRLPLNDNANAQQLHGEDDLIGGGRQHQEWRSSSEPSRRHQKLQRSFDRGDSGIENDYRKDSFNDRDLKYKQRTYDDDRRACELFLRKERRHTVENHPVQWSRSHGGGYRERSIDDGSHFDPRLDRYNNNNNNAGDGGGTLRKRREKSAERNGEKKKSGLEKVKQLLTGGGTSKKNKTATTSTSSVLTSSAGGGNSSTLKSDKLIRERRPVIDSDHSRSRFSETRTSELQSEFVEPQIPDISTRRRLSTPKSSPALPKRSPSQKSYKSSTTSDPQPQQSGKLSWFKSLDRLSRKKDKTATLPPSSSRTTSVDDRFNGQQTLKSTRMAMQQEQPQSKGNSSKTLRFFGDTDLESNASYSKASWKNKTSRQPLTSQKAFSKSAHDLDTIPSNNNNAGHSASASSNRISSSRHKSTSLQHLDETDRASNARHLNGRYNSKSRDLHDISESASDNELAAQQHHHNHLQNGSTNKKTHHSSSLLSDSSLARSGRERSPKPRSSLSSSTRAATLNRNGKLSSYDEDDQLLPPMTPPRDGRRSTSVDARINTLSRHDYRKPPPGPQKPARTFEKRRSVSRGERDRVQDSSGTEGDSSQVSRGSVVFLHATTVGDIPQPHWLNSRSRAASRESLSSKSTKNQSQPMTRTVARSYSMMSPWTPRHLRDGYEINYSQQSNQQNGLKSRNNAKQKQGSSSTSTLPKPKTRPPSSTSNNNTNTMTRYKKHTSSNSNKRNHESSFDKSSPLKSSNNHLNNHSGYRPPQATAAAMDKPVERRIFQKERRSHEEPDRYTMRRHRTQTPEPVSRYD